MSKLVCAGLIIVAFALGVYVGQMPIASLLLRDEPVVQNAEQTPPSSTTQPAGTKTISTSNLSDGQKKLLSTLGINADTFVVTPAMIVCAEAKLGATRIAEITAGATPSVSEGLVLLACYK